LRLGHSAHLKESIAENCYFKSRVSKLHRLSKAPSPSKCLSARYSFFSDVIRRRIQLCQGCCTPGKFGKSNSLKIEDKEKSLEDLASLPLNRKALRMYIISVTVEMSPFTGSFRLPYRSECISFERFSNNFKETFAVVPSKGHSTLVVRRQL